MEIYQVSAERCRDVIYSEAYGDFIVAYPGQLVGIPEEQQRECVQLVTDSSVIVYVPISGSQSINFRSFGYATIPKLYGLLDTSSMESIGVLRVRRQPYVDLLGQGVLIGIIDTGIDYQHPVFRQADGTTRIQAIWDQTQREGTPPIGFLYGGYYDQDDINEALRSDDPLSIVPVTDLENGHGTFMAGIAAGGEEEEDDFTGVAPQAGIMMVKLKEAKNNLKEYHCVSPQALAYSEADIMLGVRFLIEEAVRLLRPLVIVFGIGTNSGNHDGQTPLCRILDRYSLREGIAIVVAGGNEGNRGHHYEKLIMPPGESEEVEVKVEEGEFGLSIELWAESPALFSVGIISPLGEEVRKVPIQDRALQQFRFPFEDTLVLVEYIVVEQLTGDQIALIRFRDPTPGIWRIVVYNESPDAAGYNMWLPMEQFIKEGTYFIQPQPNTTLCEPGNTDNVMTMNAYNHYDDSIYLHASRGYTLSGERKPDLSAPGVNIYGPLPGGRFGRMTGSSIAAAHAAGCAALMLEWGIVKGNAPYMQTVRITNYFVRGARRKNIIYPNREWGYGELDFYGVFEEIFF